MLTFEILIVRLMHTISVRTTQNVFIHYPLASLGDRILGYLIDLLINIIYFIAIIAIVINFDLKNSWVIGAVLVLPFLFYKLLFEIFMNGQTPGKRAMNIKVVRTDGTPATIG
ncbi:MAG: RDD family protein [Flammeovirgaceae bacterium]